MPSETLTPDALLVQTALSGSVSALAAQDGAWLVYDGSTNGNTDCRASLPSPSGTLTGTQTARAQIRKNASGGNATTWSLQLFEAGSLVSTLATGTTASLTGEVVSGTFDASALADTSGADIEIRLEQTGGGSSGSGGNRRRIEVGYLALDATYADAPAPVEGTLAAAVAAVLFAGVGAVGVSGELAGSTDATIAAAGTVEDPAPGVTGTLSVSVDAAIAGAGAVALAGTTALVLDDASPTLAGVVALAGGLSVSLEPIAQTAQASAEIAGTSSSACEDITFAAAGAVALEGELAASLGAVAFAGEGFVGSVPIEGALAGEVELSWVAAGAVTLEGGLAGDIDTTLAAAGAVTLEGGLAGSVGVDWSAADTVVGTGPISGALAGTVDLSWVAAGGVALEGALAIMLDDAVLSSGLAPEPCYGPWIDAHATGPTHFGAT